MNFAARFNEKHPDSTIGFVVRSPCLSFMKRRDRCETMLAICHLFDAGEKIKFTSVSVLLE